MMLVLSRKRNERILIGHEIEVKVLSIEGSRVRLGINCPESVRVLRSEITSSQDLTSIPKYSLETSPSGIS